MKEVFSSNIPNKLVPMSENVEKMMAKYGRNVLKTTIIVPFLRNIKLKPNRLPRDSVVDVSDAISRVGSSVESGCKLFDFSVRTFLELCLV